MSRPRSSSKNWLLLCVALPALPYSLAAADLPRCVDVPRCCGHLDLGVMHDRAHEYESALREFQAAYSQLKDPRVAVDIGRTLHKLGRFAEALSYYKVAGKAAPADPEVQKIVQEYAAQAKQNLTEPVAAQRPLSVVKQPTFSVQTVPVQQTTTLTALNQNYINLNLGSLLVDHQPVPKPLYKRSALWIPLVGLALAASAAGAAAAWPRPWQPDSQIPTVNLYGLAAGGAK
jgi:tetratricopeptide (TPR) repeat protein